jgi:hypothetical protein
MLLTHCASCAAHLGLSSGKKCGRCSTRYCGPECQKKHWEEGGHDKLCKKIRKNGGAEQYNANKKYAEAVTVAAEACAEDTKGQTCYICMEAVHPRTGEGLVRGCACGDRIGVDAGTTGVAHVSCLVEQAKILVAEAEENNLEERIRSGWERWYECSICEQRYHGAVCCALGWGCWKTYVGRPEADSFRNMALNVLGTGFNSANHHEDALSVYEAQLMIERRHFGARHESILTVQSNIATTLCNTGRKEQALRMRRDVYFGYLKVYGEGSTPSFIGALNYGESLTSNLDLNCLKEAKVLMSKTVPMARRVLGENHTITLRMRLIYAQAVCRDASATLDDIRESVETIEDTERIARRLFGSAHPITTLAEESLRQSRAVLRARLNVRGAPGLAVTPCP